MIWIVYFIAAATLALAFDQMAIIMVISMTAIVLSHFETYAAFTEEQEIPDLREAYPPDPF
jgi:hypothetical protein